jgi:hypothetical protein
VLLVRREPKIREVVADIRHDVSLIGQTFLERLRVHLRGVNLARFRRCLRLSVGLRLEWEFGRAAQKQTGSKANRKQNARTEAGVIIHEVTFGCAIQVSAGISAAPG